MFFKFFLPILCFVHSLSSSEFFAQNTSFLPEKTSKKITPYLLPTNHVAKPLLDAIFSQAGVIENEASLQEAGFQILRHMGGSFITVAKHPAFPGYIFKLYLDSESRVKNKIPHEESLYNRCVGAARIRKFIKENKIRYFTVPDKWLYVLPGDPFSEETSPQRFILIATDMQLESDALSAFAWKHFVSKKQIDELYLILKQGYGSSSIVNNIPYTKQGKFAFTDTEYPKRKIHMRGVKKFLSEEMQEYWETLIKWQ